MLIRELNLEETPELLILRSLIEASIENKAFFNWPEEVFKDELRLSKVWILKNPNGPIQSFLIFRESLDHLEIMVLGTAPPFQKGGGMIRLIEHLQAYAAQQGVSIGLEVHEHNGAARRLYVKMGFKSLHRRKNYYKDGGAAEVFLWKNQTANE